MGWLFWLSFSMFSCMFRWCSSSVDCVHRFSQRIAAVSWYSQCISAVVWVNFVICSLPSLSSLSFPALFNVYHWWFLPFLQMFNVFVELFNVVHCFFAQLSKVLFGCPFFTLLGAKNPSKKEKILLKMTDFELPHKKSNFQVTNTKLSKFIASGLLPRASSSSFAAKPIGIIIRYCSCILSWCTYMRAMARILYIYNVH